jgi:hypothetical protein
LGGCAAGASGGVDGGSVVAVTRKSDDGVFFVAAVLHAVNDSISSA